MKIYIIIVTFLFIACQGSNFRDGENEGVRPTSTTELQSEPSAKDSTDNQVSEPVMVGGAFLHCQAAESQGELNYQANCRIELDDMKYELPPSIDINFELRLASNITMPIEFFSLEQSSDWHWSIFISKDLDFTSLRLLISTYESSHSFEVPMTADTFAPVDESPSDESPSDEASEDTLSELTSFTYKLGGVPDSGFFIAGDDQMTASQNPDCEAEEVAYVRDNPSEISRRQRFSFEVPDGGATLSIRIPRLCGVSALSGDIAWNLVRIEHPDGRRDFQELAKMADSHTVTQNSFFPEGQWTISVISYQVSASYAGPDTFIFYPIEVISNKELTLVEPMP